MRNLHQQQFLIFLRFFFLLTDQRRYGKKADMDHEDVYMRRLVVNINYENNLPIGFIVFDSLMLLVIVFDVDI